MHLSINMDFRKGPMSSHKISKAEMATRVTGRAETAIKVIRQAEMATRVTGRAETAIKVIRQAEMATRVTGRAETAIRVIRKAEMVTSVMLREANSATRTTPEASFKTDVVVAATDITDTDIDQNWSILTNRRCPVLPKQMGWG
jgi:hypothetical protein